MLSDVGTALYFANTANLLKPCYWPLVDHDLFKSLSLEIWATVAKSRLFKNQHGSLLRQQKQKLLASTIYKRSVLYSLIKLLLPPSLRQLINNFRFVMVFLSRRKILFNPKYQESGIQLEINHTAPIIFLYRRK